MFTAEKFLSLNCLLCSPDHSIGNSQKDFSLSPRRPRFDSMPIHLGFVVDKLTMQWDFLPVFWFFHVWIIDQCSPSPHTHACTRVRADTHTHTHTPLINAIYSSRLTELLCNTLQNPDTLFFGKHFVILPTSDRCSRTETLLYMFHSVHNKKHGLFLYPQPKRIHHKVKRQNLKIYNYSVSRP
jgi:hypothetical protein